jgi:hypothetical protein
MIHIRHSLTTSAVAVALALAPAALADAGGTARPFTGTAEGQVTFPVDPSCPLGVRTTWTAIGTLNHLGLAAAAGDHCADLPNLATNGQITLVAANGDRLYGTYSGTNQPGMPPPIGGTITGDTQVKITGGTGRFASAGGQLHMIAHITFEGFDDPTWPAAFTWTGTLSY